MSKLEHVNEDAEGSFCCEIHETLRHCYRLRFPCSKCRVDTMKNTYDQLTTDPDEVRPIQIRDLDEQASLTQIEALVELYEYLVNVDWCVLQHDDIMVAIYLCLCNGGKGIHDLPKVIVRKPRRASASVKADVLERRQRIRDLEQVIRNNHSSIKSTKVGADGLVR